MVADRAWTGAAGSTDRVVVIIPWRDRGDVDRRANLDTVTAHLTSAGFDWFTAGDDQDGPFNRSAAYNHGREEHPADVYVWHEADMLVPPEQLHRGIAQALESPGLVVPFTHYQYLGKHVTRMVRDAGYAPSTFRPEWVMPDGKSIGAVGITSEATMAAVGRWDDTFSGWGYDDNAMFHAFGVCASTSWIEGPAWHLYHEPGWTPSSEADAEATRANAARLEVYRRASTPEQIRALTGAEHGSR